MNPHCQQCPKNLHHPSHKKILTVLAQDHWSRVQSLMCDGCEVDNIVDESE